MIVMNGMFTVKKNNDSQGIFGYTHNKGSTKIGKIQASYNELDAIFGKNNSQMSDIYGWCFNTSCHKEFFFQLPLTFMIYIFKPETDPRDKPDELHNWSIGGDPDYAETFILLIKDCIHKKMWEKSGNSLLRFNTVKGLADNDLINRVRKTRTSDGITPSDRICTWAKNTFHRTWNI